MNARTLHLLHVDDQEDDRFFLQRAVATAARPIRLTSFSSGFEALTLLPSLTPPPDLLLIDIRMPEMSGFDLLRQLKGGAYAKVPAAMFSSSEHDTDIIHAQELAADAYFVKPAGFEGLVVFVRELYDRWAAGALPPAWPHLERQ